jgi:hypothetical protein
MASPSVSFRGNRSPGTLIGRPVTEEIIEIETEVANTLGEPTRESHSEGNFMLVPPEQRPYYSFTTGRFLWD